VAIGLRRARQRGSLGVTTIGGSSGTELREGSSAPSARPASTAR
jgi:hypothetical protein